MKKILVIILLAILNTAGVVIGYIKGAEKVRNGLVANFPTVKNLVQGTTVEFDSVVSISLTRGDDETLFNLLKADSKVDSVLFSIPYYARYGVDLTVRNFRLFRNEETVEVWLPDTKLQYCELKFDRMLLNGKTTSNCTATLRTKLYEYIIPLLEKNKTNRKISKTATVKTLMYYFMPYKFELKVYIAEEQQTLPSVPGVNQTVDEAINQMLGK
ncbi:MAG: hypothetical protein NTY88_02310 [Bacteroidetes bacterium]|nr:hypothetical protein [Bacteroidota bacterium]